MARPQHIFSVADMDVLRAIAAGTITLTDGALQIGASRDACQYKMMREGLGNAPGSIKAKAARQHKQDAPQPIPHVRDGFIPIAHKADRKWVELEGAPISIQAARLAVADGRATMAHRRVDGGFDLLFKVVR